MDTPHTPAAAPSEAQRPPHNTPVPGGVPAAPVLHSTADGVRLHTLVLPLAAHAAAGGADAPVTAEIIPPPGPGGCIEGADGRRQYASDMAALAAAIAAQPVQPVQPVQPRIDCDHSSERTSPTFRGSTAARGWVRAPRTNARGGIDADLHLDADIRAALGREEYRYLSPALRLDAEERIVGGSPAHAGDGQRGKPERPDRSERREPDEQAGRAVVMRRCGGRNRCRRDGPRVRKRRTGALRTRGRARIRTGP